MGRRGGGGIGGGMDSETLYIILGVVAGLLFLYLLYWCIKRSNKQAVEAEEAAARAAAAQPASTGVGGKHVSVVVVPHNASTTANSYPPMVQTLAQQPNFNMPLPPLPQSESTAGQAYPVMPSAAPSSYIPASSFATPAPVPYPTTSTYSPASTYAPASTYPSPQPPPTQYPMMAKPAPTQQQQQPYPF